MLEHDKERCQSGLMYFFAKEVDPLNGPASSNLALSALIKNADIHYWYFLLIMGKCCRDSNGGAHGAKRSLFSAENRCEPVPRLFLSDGEEKSRGRISPPQPIY